MKHLRFVILSVVLYLVLFNISVSAQLYGKFYTIEEAESLYGKVDHSIGMNVEQLESLLLNTQNVIMFKLDNGTLGILGDDRAPLLVKKEYAQGEIFHAFSKSIFQIFLNQRENETIKLELRGKIFTANNGNQILEQSFPCPPFCD